MLFFDYLSNSALSVQAILCFHPSLQFLDLCHAVTLLSKSTLPTSSSPATFHPPCVPPFLHPPFPCQWQCTALWVVLPDICSFPCTVMPCIERYCNIYNIKCFLFCYLFVFQMLGRLFLYLLFIICIFGCLQNVFFLFFCLFYESWDF